MSIVLETIDDLKEKLRQAEENYHWANQDRDTLRHFLEKLHRGIELHCRVKGKKNVDAVCLLVR